MKLAEVRSTGGQDREALQAVDEAFGKRNADKRLIDHEGVDGDGSVSVKWDLRKQSILAAGRSPS
jgi:hypothetical protein